MPRRKLIRQNQFPYHVTIRSNNKEWFKIPLYEMWELCYECLLYAQEKAQTNIHSFVLMSNHYHLLISTPQSNLDKFMEAFNKRLSHSIKRFNGAENHKFANRYKWSIIESYNYLINVYRYIYQNPVRAGLCKLCLDYPYSSLRFSPMQTRKLGITVHIDYFKYRSMMDSHQSNEINETIRKGLKKEKFAVSSRSRTYVKNVLNS